MPSEIFLHWQAKEYEKRNKSTLWYLAVALPLGGFILYSLYTNNPIVAVTFILIGVVGYLLLEKNPEIIDFALSEDGIHAGNELYPYENIHSFWIFSEPDEPQYLSVHTDSIFLPSVRIPFEETDPEQIRTILINHVPEKRHGHGLVDILHDLF